MPSTKLRHGIFLPPYHPLEEGATASLKHDLDMCEVWDRLGFDEIWVGEHHSSGFETIASPEVFIAHAAAITKRITFGTGVISLPYHNPLTVVNRLVQLDHQTEGRIKFGFGPGLLVQDAAMFGIDPSNARDMMLESLDVVIRLLNGETVTHKGAQFNLVNARAHLLPYTDPMPEIAVASALSPTAARAAGKYGLSMLCVAAADVGGYNVLGSNWEVALDAAAQHGKTLSRDGLRLVAPMHIAETREQARQNMKHGLERWLKYYNMVGVNAYGDSDPIDAMVNSGRAVIGTPDDAIAMIERFREKQGDYGMFMFQHNEWADRTQTIRSYDLYARHVMPKYSRAEANRKISYDILTDHSVEYTKSRLKAVGEAFQKHGTEAQQEFGAKIRQSAKDTK